MPETQEKFVIVSTLVNDHRQGDVVTADQLRTFDPNDKGKVLHDARDRLLGLGAIRPTVEGEEGMAHVPVAQVGLSPAQMAAIGTLDATIEKLTNDVAAHEERARTHETLRGGTAPLPTPQEDPAFAAAIQERQARVEALRKRLEAASSKADEHVAALREESQAAATEQPQQAHSTGQAIPSGEGQQSLRTVTGVRGMPAGPSGEEQKQPSQDQTNRQREQAAAEEQRQRQRQEQEAREQQAAEEQRQRRGKRGGGE